MYRERERKLYTCIRVCMYVCMYIYIYIAEAVLYKASSPTRPRPLPSAGRSSTCDSFHPIPFQLTYHPKVALAARLIIGLGNTNACAPSSCMYADY